MPTFAWLMSLAGVLGVGAAMLGVWRWHLKPTAPTRSLPEDDLVAPNPADFLISRPAPSLNLSSADQDVKTEKT